MDISGGVASAVDLVDQGVTPTLLRSSFKFFPRAHFLNFRNMPPPPMPTSRTDIGRSAGKSARARFSQSRVGREASVKNVDTLEIAQMVIEFLNGNRIGIHQFGRCGAG
jgi:hypothetical protein